MEARQEAKYNMFRAVEQHCVDNPSAVSSLAAFSTAFSDLTALNTQIGDLVQLQDAPLVGLAGAKTNTKQSLAEMAANVAGSVFALAAVAGDENLKQQVNFSLSKLLATRDDEMAPRCQNIHDRANDNFPAIKDYGVEQPTLVAFQAAIDAYAAAAPKPRVALSNRKTQLANLVELLKQGDAILKLRMDKMIGSMRAAHPDFVSTFYNVRTIVDPATSRTVLKGTVSSLADEKPIHGATVQVLSNEVPPAVLASASTNTRGNYRIKPAPAGNFTVKITALGHNDLSLPETQITLGATTDLDAEMESD